MAYGRHAARILTLEEISGIDVVLTPRTPFFARSRRMRHFVYPGPEARDISASKDLPGSASAQRERERGRGRAEDLDRLAIGGLSELLDERIPGVGGRVHGCGFQANQHDAGERGVTEDRALMNLFLVEGVQCGLGRYVLEDKVIALSGLWMTRPGLSPRPARPASWVTRP